MTIVTVDTRQFSGEDTGLEPDNGSVWFWPYRPYIEDEALVSREILKVRTVDGIATPVLPQTPVGEAVWVQLRGIKGAGEPWLIQVPATDCNLVDLPHIDPETLDPTVEPTPYWLTYMDAAIADAIDGILDGAPGAMDTLAELAAALGDDPNFATTIVESLGEKVDQTTYATAIAAIDAAIATKADDAATAAALATKVNSATYVAGLAAKADTTALTAETSARDAADQVLATTISDYATTLNTALGTKADAAATTASLATKANQNDTRFLRAGLQSIVDLTNSLGINGTLSYYPSHLDATVLGALSYFGYAMPKTNGRFRFAGAYGHVGYTSTQLLAEYLPTVLATSADYVHLQVVSNDPGNSVPIATTKANVTSMVQQIIAAGKVPILATMPPLGSPVSGNTGASLTFITQYNTWVKRYAGAQRLPIVDYHSVTVNPADNNPITMGTFWNADGVHPLAPGAKAMGDALASVLNTLPAQARFPLAASYNPNLLLPDAVFTSAAGDKWTTSGGTAGGWAHRSLAGISSSGLWKGNQFIVSRGSTDYSYLGPIPNNPWVAGNRVRVAFNIDVSNVPASGTWSAYLYNFTQSQAICGFSGMTATVTKESVTATGCTVTSASKTITSPTSIFRPYHIGKQVTATVGVVGAFAAGAVIDGISADGLTATASVASGQTQTGTSIVTIHAEPCQSVWEFTVQSDMVGDDIRFATAVGGAAGTTLGISQVTVTDLTALGAV